MDKKERLERFKYLSGLSSWDVASYKSKINVTLNDGPCGVRKPISNNFNEQEEVVVSVCMPNPSALAASFNNDVVYKNGQLLALNCLKEGVNVLLAPGVNIKRNVLCGRNFEYFSEDPVLSGILASEYINGLEDSGVGACIKHYCCNSQEFFRRGVTSILSLRALNEIYLRSFSIALKYSKPTGLMTSYNKVNDEFPGESPYLLQKKLRGEYSFKGFICSDWGGVSNKDKCINVGTNLEMPISLRTPEYHEKLFEEGKISEAELIKRDEELDNAIKKFYVKRVIKEEDYNLDKLHEEAIDVATKTVVLAKNENAYLPLKKEEKVLVLGYFGEISRFVGGGSGWVNAYKKDNFLKVLNEENINYIFLKCYEPGKLLTTKEELSKYKNKFDKVVLFLGQYQEDESEGRDRKVIDLHKEQTETIKLVKEVFGNFASIIITGSVLNVEEVFGKSTSMIISYLAGEGQSKALFNNLYGNYNPSARLPETWISSLDQNPLIADFKKYNPFYVYYDEDIFVGYRYYDEHKKGFMLPFGYGLSYSTFEYSNFKVVVEYNLLRCFVTVKNTSNVDGNDVIEVYTSLDKSNVYRPKKEFKGFKNVFIKAKESKEVEVDIDLDLLGVYDYETDKLVVEKGAYDIIFAKNADEIIKTVKNVEIDGTTLKENKVPQKLIRRDPEAKFLYESPIGTALETPKFKEYLIKIGFDEKEIDKIDHNHWLAISNIPNLSQKLDFFKMDELLDILNNSDAKDKIKDYLKGVDVESRF